MTTAFAVGDKVEFIEGYYGHRHITKGETAVVRQGGGDLDLIHVTLDKDGGKTECFGKRVKLQTPATPTFKAGDKVRNTGKGNPSWAGVEGTVVRHDGKTTFGNNERYMVKITALPTGFTYHSVGAEVRMTDVNMELVEAAAPAKRELKVGDKVRVIDDGFTDKDWIGVEGVVIELKNATGGWPYNNKVQLTKPPVGLEVGYIASLRGHNCEVIDSFPRPITFAEIQKGDTIRRTLTKDNGSKVIKEGVVVDTSMHIIYDSNCETYLASHTDDGHSSVTLELLARPEPEPVKEPEIWENRAIGDQIVLEKGAGYSNWARIFTKIADDKWASLFVDNNGAIDKGYVRSDRIVGEYLTERKDRKAQLITAS